MWIASFDFLNRGFLQHSLQLSEFPEKTGKETPLRLGYVGMWLRVWQDNPGNRRIDGATEIPTEVKSSKRAAGGSIHGKHPDREFWLKAEPMKFFFGIILQDWKKQIIQLMPVVFVFEFVTEICWEIKDS